MTDTLTTRQHSILLDCYQSIQNNGCVSLRPEEIAFDEEDFYEISDAMFAFADLGLGTADSAGGECTGFTPEMERVSKALRDWEPKGVNATEVVSMRVYTRAEAIAEHARIEQLAMERGWSGRAVAAYKAHVTRRVGA